MQLLLKLPLKPLKLSMRPNSLLLRKLKRQEKKWKQPKLQLPLNLLLNKMLQRKLNSKKQPTKLMRISNLPIKKSSTRSKRLKQLLKLPLVRELRLMHYKRSMILLKLMKPKPRMITTQLTSCQKKLKRLTISN